MFCISTSSIKPVQEIVNSIAARIIYPVIFSLLVILNSAQAGVNLKNGNYYISYADIAMPGEAGIEITRTYNSKSTSKGLFGFGWGSQYETYLITLGDGTIVIHEHGAGSRTVFLPPELYGEDLEKSVDILLAAKEAESPFESLQERLEQRNKLLNTHALRTVWQKKYIKKNRLVNNILKPGTVYRTSRGGVQTLIRTQTGYQRIDKDSVSDFDIHGRLIRKRGSKGEDHYIHRDPEGRISRIVSAAGNEVKFHYNDNNTVHQIEKFIQGKYVSSAKYQYSGKRLIYSKDTGDHVYRYRYDNNYNMIAVGYENGNERIITYEDRTYFIRSLTSEKNGETTWYKYGGEGKNYYYTEETKYNSQGEVSIKRSDYWIRQLENGIRFTERRKIDNNGDVSDIRFTSFGWPLLIHKSNKDDVKLSYDNLGRLINYDNGSDSYALKYWRSKKWVSSINVEKNSVGMSQQYGFTYNSDGKLVSIAFNDNELLHVKYDGDGNINALNLNGVILSLAYRDGKLDRLALNNAKSFYVKRSGEEDDGSVSVEGYSESDLKLIKNIFKIVSTVQKPFDIFMSISSECRCYGNAILSSPMTHFKKLNAVQEWFLNTNKT